MLSVFFKKNKLAKSHGKTYTTLGYKELEAYTLGANSRPVNNAHLRRIKNQMPACFDRMLPVVINKTTDHVINGLHRIMAFRLGIEDGTIPANEKLDVMFINIPENEENATMAAANTNAKSWTLDDYVAYNIASGNESYKELEKFCLSHELCGHHNIPKYRYGYAIIKGGSDGGATLKNGSFVCTEEELQTAGTVHDEMLSILKLYKSSQGTNGHWIEALASSWTNVRDKYSFGVWQKELRKAKYRKMAMESKKHWDAIFGIADEAIQAKLTKATE